MQAQQHALQRAVRQAGQHRGKACTAVHLSGLECKKSAVPKLCWVLTEGCLGAGSVHAQSVNESRSQILQRIKVSCCSVQLGQESSAPGSHRGHVAGLPQSRWSGYSGGCSEVDGG